MDVNAAKINKLKKLIHEYRELKLSPNSIVHRDVLEAVASVIGTSNCWNAISPKVKIKKTLAKKQLII